MTQRFPSWWPPCYLLEQLSSDDASSSSPSAASYGWSGPLSPQMLAKTITDHCAWLPTQRVSGALKSACSATAYVRLWICDRGLGRFWEQRRRDDLFYHRLGGCLLLSVCPVLHKEQILHHWQWFSQTALGTWGWIFEKLRRVDCFRIK